MIITTAYTRNQRYQLSRLAEQPKLTPSQYEAQCSAILDGAEPFGACPEDWVRSQLRRSTTRTPKHVVTQQILEQLHAKGEMPTAGLRDTLGFEESYIREKVLRAMLEQGLVTRRTVTQTQGGKTFLWSAV